MSNDARPSRLCYLVNCLRLTFRPSPHAADDAQSCNTKVSCTVKCFLRKQHEILHTWHGTHLSDSVTKLHEDAVSDVRGALPALEVEFFCNMFNVKRKLLKMYTWNVSPSTESDQELRRISHKRRRCHIGAWTAENRALTMVSAYEGHAQVIFTSWTTVDHILTSDGPDDFPSICYLPAVLMLSSTNAGCKMKPSFKWQKCCLISGLGK